MSSPQGPLLLRLRMGHLLRLPQGGILSQALQVSSICLFLRRLFPTLLSPNVLGYWGHVAKVADGSPNPFHLLPGHTAKLHFPSSLAV